MKVEVAALGSPSLIRGVVSVDVNRHVRRHSVQARVEHEVRPPRVKKKSSVSIQTVWVLFVLA